MKLELGNFYVKDICFGDETGYDQGVLTINKEEALAVVRKDKHIIAADLVLAKPGEEVRIVPVKDAFAIRHKVSGGNDFPGVINELTTVGSGRTHALQGCCVLSVGKHLGDYQDGVIDMSGPGAPYTIYSQLHNICLVADSDEDFEKDEAHKTNHALRWAGMRLTDYLGKCLADLEPEEIEIYELPPISKRAPEVQKLPGVVYVIQLCAQMLKLGYNELVYGWDSRNMLPTIMHPNEFLDGAITSGSFMPSSSRISHYEHVNNPTIKRLLAEHGKTINFLGVIASTLPVITEEKIRAAKLVRQLAGTLGADAAIVVKEAYGNPDFDFMEHIVELEDAGIKVVAIGAECDGRDGESQPLMVLDKKANAIVSAGNVSEIIELPPMAKVIGELESLARDGFSGAWDGSVKEDGSIIVENNVMFCSDGIVGINTKTVVEY